MSRPPALALVVWTDIHRHPTDAVGEVQCQYLRDAAVQSRQIAPGVSVSTVIAYFFCISAAIFGFKRFAHSGAVGYASVAS